VKPPRLVLLAVAGASLFAFTGCSPVGDVAIKVNDTTLSNEDVDLFTSFLCNYRAEAGNDPNAGVESAGVPIQQARTEAARLLVQSLVLERAAAEEGISDELTGIEQTLVQFNPLIDASATGEDRARLKELLIDSISSSSRIETAVNNAMVEELGDAINQLPQDQGQAIFDQKFAEFLNTGLSSADLEIDPVFGVDPDTLEVGQESSLSAPVSQFAKDAAEPNPSAEWLAALPQNFRCG